MGAREARVRVGGTDRGSAGAAVFDGAGGAYAELGVVKHKRAGGGLANAAAAPGSVGLGALVVAHAGETEAILRREVRDGVSEVTR